LSGQFFQQSLFAAVDTIHGAIVTSQTYRNVMSQPKYGQINCGLTILIMSLFSLCCLQNTTQLRSGTADKSKWPVFLQNTSGNPMCHALDNFYVHFTCLNIFCFSMQVSCRFVTEVVSLFNCEKPKKFRSKLHSLQLRFSN